MPKFFITAEATYTITIKKQFDIKAFNQEDAYSKVQMPEDLEQVSDRNWNIDKFEILEASVSAIPIIESHVPMIWPQLLNREQAAGFLGLDADDFTAYLNNKKIPEPRLFETKEVWDKNELLDWIKTLPRFSGQSETIKATIPNTGPAPWSANTIGETARIS